MAGGTFPTSTSWLWGAYRQNGVAGNGSPVNGGTNIFFSSYASNNSTSLSISVAIQASDPGGNNPFAAGNQDFGCQISLGSAGPTTLNCQAAVLCW